MPEGDTIHRTARTLAKAIGKRTVTRCTLADDLVGRTVESVEARGKNLLVRFDDGRTLHTHMMMDGSWHIYRPGERWQRGTFAAVAVVETDAWVAVCFDAPVVELLPPGVEPELVRRLGPDLLDPQADPSEAVSRMRAYGELPIGEALLRQHLVAGIGNVYKSEALFLARVDPFMKVAMLGDPTLESVLGHAQRLMKQNLVGHARVTRRRFSGARLWVYGRSGRPCLECGNRIRMRRQGEMARSTYYCPRCQGVLR
jgi:endonuclease-8